MPGMRGQLLRQLKEPTIASGERVLSVFNTV